jgi:hypothetical protein
MEGKIITCCLYMCPIPVLFSGQKGEPRRGKRAGNMYQGRCERGRGVHAMGGMSEVHPEKNTGI